MSTIVSNPYEFTVLNSCSFDHYYSNNSELKIEVYDNDLAIYNIIVPEDVFLLEVFPHNNLPIEQTPQYVKVTPGMTYRIQSYIIYTESGKLGYYVGNVLTQTVWYTNSIGDLFDNTDEFKFAPMDPANYIVITRSLNITPTVYDEFEIAATQLLSTNSTNEAVTTPPPYLNNFIYPLTNQFGGIYLQLHSSSVSNPYTFTITNNKIFSAVTKAQTPGTQLGPYKYIIGFYNRTNNYEFTLDNTDSRYLSIVMEAYNDTSTSTVWKYTLYYSNGRSTSDTGYYDHSGSDSEPKCKVERIS